MYLGCQGELCDDDAMRHIASLPKLRMLMGQGTIATDEGFRSLSRSQTIEYIWGRECPNLKSEGFVALSRMPALKGLAVSCKFVDDAALASLPDFPVLRELLPIDVSDDGFRHIGRSQRLESLILMYCRDTTDVATGHIRKIIIEHKGDLHPQVLVKDDNGQIIAQSLLGGWAANGVPWRIAPGLALLLAAALVVPWTSRRAFGPYPSATRPPISDFPAWMAATILSKTLPTPRSS